ncbi:MAG: flavodoxin [Chitinophagales bacterium]|nr:flavodoxin [Chitinophagales bacterium]
MGRKIGLFYGTDTGNTERIAQELKEILIAKNSDLEIDIHEIYKKEPQDLQAYDLLIIGMPTWYDGELQGDWEVFLPKFGQVNFIGKTIAFFGLGDQYGYSFYFGDALGVFYEIAKKNGANIVGQWPIKGYEYDASKAEIDGQLVGLLIDVDNQDEMTQERLEQWTDLILPHFSK